MVPPKPLKFRGDSLNRLRDLPKGVRIIAGQQLDRVQHGLEPIDWKPMSAIGPGVREIRIREERGVFRIIYIAKFAEAVYVLHCFQKKSQKTSPADLALALHRYRDLQKEQIR